MNLQTLLKAAFTVTLAMTLSACNDLAATLPSGTPPSVKGTLPAGVLSAGNPVAIKLEVSGDGDLSVVQKSGPTAQGSVKDKVLTVTPPSAGDYVYTVSLKAADGTSVSSEIKFSVAAGTGTIIPVPVPGAAGVNVTLASSALLGTTVPLRPSGLPTGASCTWSVTGKPLGSSATIEPGCNTRFKPDLKGDYSLQLIAFSASAQGTQSQEVARLNLGLYVYNDAPTALITKVAGQEKVYSPLTFDSVSSSDPEGMALSRRWALLEKPLSANPEFKIDGAQATLRGDRSGRYTVGLIVNDGVQDSVEAKVSLNLVNTPPVSNPGANQVVTVGSTATLSGAASMDPEGGPLKLSWELISRPVGSLAGLSNTRGDTTAFVTDKAGDYVAELKVSDGEFESSKTVTVTASAPAPAK